tara:strand:- start:1065 stop:1286 length:222 start_codon:yes stop_codon:yes gene_type:complete
VPELVASVGIIAAASISAISAVLVARLRFDYRSQVGIEVDLLREINKRTTRIEDRVNDHGERIATIEGRHAAQ